MAEPLRATNDSALHVERHRRNVLDQIALFDDLRGHAERMLRAGATADEAERRYAVPKRFETYAIDWGFGVGPAIRNYYAKLPRA